MKRFLFLTSGLICQRPLLFFAGLMLAAGGLGGGWTLAATGGPVQVVGQFPGVVVESSRDIDGTPMAVVELPSGDEQFVEGTYLEGSPISVPLDADGDVVHYFDTGLGYWFLFTIIAFGAVVLGFLAALFIRSLADEFYSDWDNRRKWSQSRWYADTQW